MPKVAPGVHMVPVVYRRTGGILNLGLLVGDTLTLIDAGGAGVWEDIHAYLDSIGRRPQDLTRILMTHRHVDHMGGLSEIKDATGAVVAASAVDAPYIEGKTPHPIRPGFEASYAGLKPATVEEILKEGDRLPGFEEFEVLETPGHTMGHLSFYSREKGVLFAGDLLRLSEGKVAGPFPHLCDDLVAAHNSVRRLASLDFATLVAYHGGVAPSDADRQTRELVDTLQQ